MKLVLLLFVLSILNSLSMIDNGVHGLATPTNHKRILAESSLPNAGTKDSTTTTNQPISQTFFKENKIQVASVDEEAVPTRSNGDRVVPHAKMKRR